MLTRGFTLIRCTVPYLGNAKGTTNKSKQGCKRKFCTRLPASELPTTSSATATAPIPVATSRGQPCAGCRGNKMRGLSGQRKIFKRWKGPYFNHLWKLLCPTSTTTRNPFQSTHVGSKILCEDLSQSDDDSADIHQCHSLSPAHQAFLPRRFYFLHQSHLLPHLSLSLSSFVPASSITCNSSSKSIFTYSHGAADPSATRLRRRLLWARGIELMKMRTYFPVICWTSWAPSLGSWRWLWIWAICLM